jgi:molybdopterin synthase sulfur carrier subunit
MRIHIQIKLFASLLEKSPANADLFPVAEGTTVASLADLLGIDPKDAKLIFINGRKGALDSVLAEGDRVGLFPPVGGG